MTACVMCAQPRHTTGTAPGPVQKLRARYEVGLLGPFQDALTRECRAGVAILDVGGGRHPTLAGSCRPPASTYVGLDLSLRELSKAPAGAYDEIVAADVTRFVPALAGRFDIAVSWQVLEHVRPLPRAVANVREYLRDGGVFVAQLSGRWSLFAMLNRLLPAGMSRSALSRLLARDPRTVFPAHYDDCTASALLRAFGDWSDVSIVPEHLGATYFTFSSLVRRAYLRWEDAVEANDLRDLATHYLIVARK